MGYQVHTKFKLCFQVRSKPDMTHRVKQINASVLIRQLFVRKGFSRPNKKARVARLLKYLQNHTKIILVALKA